jgi:deoxyribonuclease V
LKGKHVSWASTIELRRASLPGVQVLPLVDPWPGTAEEAEAVQERLRHLVSREATSCKAVRLAAGLDVAYARDDLRLAAAVAVLDVKSFEIVDLSVHVDTCTFGYYPGLFAFREVPALARALERLRTTPDVLVCDGHGIAHPRRFGLACHIGVLTDLPSVGVAKARLAGTYAEPAWPRGASTDLIDGDEVVGRVVRTQDGVRPVFVSIGHRIDLDDACRLALALCDRYRLPETTRAADRLARAALQKAARL